MFQTTNQHLIYLLSDSILSHLSVYAKKKVHLYLRHAHLIFVYIVYTCRLVYLCWMEACSRKPTIDRSRLGDFAGKSLMHHKGGLGIF